MPVCIISYYKYNIRAWLLFIVIQHVVHSSPAWLDKYLNPTMCW
jgi:hypothetical protein